MSQQAVGFVIDRLLTDQEFRDRFSEHPLEMLAHLHLCTDIELTVEEMCAFVQVDPKVWSTSARVTMGAAD